MLNAAPGIPVSVNSSTGALISIDVAPFGIPANAMSPDVKVIRFANYHKILIRGFLDHRQKKGQELFQDGLRRHNGGKV